MKRHVAWLCVLACAAGAAPSRGQAQTADTLFATGVHAYKNLEFDLAASLLRRDLARRNVAAVPVAERARGLAYLGAAEWFRGRRDSAVVVFRRLVMLDPRYRPDRLIFPPEVTSAFDAVRLQTKTALIVLPGDTAVVLGTTLYRFWIVVSSFQQIDVSLRYEDGAPFRPLYVGPVGDSLDMSWDGLDAAGGPPAVSRMVLRVLSRAPTGELASIVQVPLAVTLVPADTLPWPPGPAASDLLPERADGAAAKRALLGGLLVSSAVLVLPAVVGESDTPSEPRVAVAGTIGLATALGFILHRPGRPLPDNVRANQAQRDAWQQRIASVTAENARRRRDVRLTVRGGEPTTIQPRGP